MALQAGPPVDGWEGRADSARTALLRGGALAVAVWTRPSIPVTFLVARVRSASAQRATSILVLTNRELDAAEAEHVRTAAGAVEISVYGAHELSAIVDGRPALRRRVPSVLGVRNLADLIPDALVGRSTADLEAARALARVFVPTRAHARTLAVLEHHHFAVVTGPPEMGKTAIARMIGLAAMTEGWEVHECIRPDELWTRFSRDRAQVFVADDAFGSTEYRPDAAERWALELDRILRAMDERHWLIWTSRPAPLKAGLRRVHREHGVERFPQPPEVHVDAAALDVEEKALILFRHVKAARPRAPTIRLVQRHGWEIVSHPHFTPERIRRFVGDRLPKLAGPSEPSPRELARAVDAEIREPTTAMASSLRALPAEHRALLVALVDTPPGPVPERDLAAAARRHADTGFPRPPGELVDRLFDHFVRLVPPMSVTWVHPSWRDLVIDEVAADATARRDFLSRCSVEGVLLALSVGGGAAGERNFPLLIADGDWDALTDRLRELVPDLDDPTVYRLLAALDTALEAAPDDLAGAEVEAVAAAALDLVRQRWDAWRGPIPATLLGAWFAVAARLPAQPVLPDLAATWIELLPTSSVDLNSASELNLVEEWLTVVELLKQYAPDALRTFGYSREAEAIARVSRRGPVDLPLESPAQRPSRVSPERSIVERILGDLGP